MKLERIKSVEVIDPNYDVDVYDFELPVEHNFFANDILVHNTDSIFTKYGDALKAIYGDEYDDVSDTDKINKVIELNESVAQYINNVMIPDLLEKHNTSATESSAKKFNFNFKQELVIRKALFIEAKKKYATWLVSKEGKPLDKINITGLEIVRSDFPKFSRDMMRNVVNDILKKGITKEDLIIMLSQYKDQYMELLKTGSTDAAIPSSWNKENYASIPRAVKSMLIYNAVYGNTFKILDRGYRFDLENINISQFDETVRKRLTDLVESGKMGKEGKLDCITIPSGSVLDTSKFTIDYNKMVGFAIDDRLKNFCEIFGISIEDPDAISWI